MKPKFKYAVKFVGYSAYVVTRKHGKEITRAILDFVTGGLLLTEDGGTVWLKDRKEVARFARGLPKLVPDLEDLLHRLSLSPDCEVQVGPYSAVKRVVDRASGMQPDAFPRSDLRSGIEIEIAPGCCLMVPGGCSIALWPGTDIKKFLLRTRNGFTEKFVQVLEQAGAVGASISRRPYSEFRKEIKETGYSRIESHGYGLFIGGRLNFYPHKQTVLTRPTEDKRTFLVTPVSQKESSRLN